MTVAVSLLPSEGLVSYVLPMARKLDEFQRANPFLPGIASVLLPRIAIDPSETVWVPDTKALETEARMAGETDWVKYFKQHGSGFRPPTSHLRLAALPRQRLPHAQLRGAKLESANLAQTQLRGADLGGAQLRGADLGGAQLQGANLHSALLEGATLTAAQLQGAKLIRSGLKQARMNWANLQRADLTDSILLQAELHDANLQGATLTRAILYEVDLTYAKLESADLIDVDLTMAKLRNATLQHANLRSAKLKGADLKRARLAGANLASAELPGADLTNAGLDGANLANANLQGALLKGTRLQGASLWAAKLQGADLREAQLQGADLLSAEFQGADLRSAQLQGALLQGTVLAGAAPPPAAGVTDLVWNKKIRLNSNCVPVDQSLIGNLNLKADSVDWGAITNLVDRLPEKSHQGFLERIQDARNRPPGEALSVLKRDPKVIQCVVLPDLCGKDQENAYPESRRAAIQGIRLNYRVQNKSLTTDIDRTLCTLPACADLKGNIEGLDCAPFAKKKPTSGKSGSPNPKRSGSKQPGR